MAEAKNEKSNLSPRKTDVDSAFDLRGGENTWVSPGVQFLDSGQINVFSSNDRISTGADRLRV